MAYRGTLERVGFGICRIPISRVTASAIPERAPSCPQWRRAEHETAPDLHDLCDVNPALVRVTVPPGTRVCRRLPDWLAVHRGPAVGAATPLMHDDGLMRMRRAIVPSLPYCSPGRSLNQRRGLAADWITSR